VAVRCVWACVCVWEFEELEGDDGENGCEWDVEPEVPTDHV
jgi:hypothetical protein